MYLLIPGRHHLITQFQFDYLRQLIATGLNEQKDIHQQPIASQGPITAVIFAITSANHSNTRRNPLPFHLRAMAIESMSKKLDIPVYVFGVDDVGLLPNFADYTLKRIRHESDGQFNCQPDNTVVICSSPVLQMYAQMGFSILPAELASLDNWRYHTAMPWDVVQLIAHDQNWEQNTHIMNQIQSDSLVIWQKYQLGKKAKLLFSDQMIGSDGDLTTSRDYNVYVRQMDDIAELKYQETAPFVQPGRIGDIGCAVGSWIKLACKEERLKESDFFGIEVSRHLFEICRQRKENKAFDNPFVFFAQKNAVTGLAFAANSMNTIHSSSLTHEIESYGSRQDLLQFISNRHEELVAGGVWVNRDVVAPYNKTQMVHLWLNQTDGSNETPNQPFADTKKLAAHLQSLSTFGRFLRFAVDFRQQEGFSVPYQLVKHNEENYIHISLQLAAEFLSRKDYCDNWQSEMHETFCFWDFDEWKAQLMDKGFRIHPQSYAFTNQWIVQNRLVGKAQIFDVQFQPMDFPVTNMLLIGIK
jgi:SAM-dependent methyltransferase